MNTRRLAAALAAATLLFAAGCGGSKSSSATSARGAGAAQSSPAKNIHFAKAKFALHAALAFGAFHRYIYKPFKEGAFSHPLQHKASLAKAAAAALFVVHEVRKAREDAQASPLLTKLLSPLSSLAATVTGLGSSLKAGRVDTGGLTSANDGISAIKVAASSVGVHVGENARVKV